MQNTTSKDKHIKPKNRICSSRKAEVDNSREKQFIDESHSHVVKYWCFLVSSVQPQASVWDDSIINYLSLELSTAALNEKTNMLFFFFFLLLLCTKVFLCNFRELRQIKIVSTPELMNLQNTCLRAVIWKWYNNTETSKSREP